MSGLGPWSKAVVAQSSELINSCARLDGPYGRLSIDPAQYSHCVIVVGGAHLHCLLVKWPWMDVGMSSSFDCKMPGNGQELV